MQKSGMKLETQQLPTAFSSRHLNICSHYRPEVGYNCCHCARNPAYRQRGLSLPLSLPLLFTPMWWQTPERSPLLVIELTSFSKYQKPCCIIKICLSWGTYFWHKPNSAMYRKQSCACCELVQDEGNRLCFSGLEFSLVQFFSPSHSLSLPNSTTVGE